MGLSISVSSSSSVSAGASVMASVSIAQPSGTGNARVVSPYHAPHGSARAGGARASGTPGTPGRDELRYRVDAVEVVGHHVVVAHRQPVLLLDVPDQLQDRHRIDDPRFEKRVGVTDAVRIAIEARL